MLKVLCTVVFVLGSGYRHVEQLDGIVLKSTSGPRILVDFGNTVPVGPEAVWVNENDCQYYQDPVKYYEEEQRVKQQFLNDLKKIGK